MFTIDLFISFLVLCMISCFFILDAFIIAKQTRERYAQFILQKKIFDASEALITTAGSPRDWVKPERIGLAEYSENSVKHHILSEDKIKKMSELGLDFIKENLLLEDYEVNIVIKKRNGIELLNIGEKIKGTSVKRIALCGEEPCVLEITAK